MATKWNRRTLFTSVALFIALPLLIGVLVYLRMETVIHTYTQMQVEAQAEILKRLASETLSNRLGELERVAGYLKDGVVSEEDLGDVAQRLLFNTNQKSFGIVRLGGRAVTGQNMPPAEYPAIRNAFRGKSTVRYREDGGLLFAAPIYNNGNIKYAVYEFFDDESFFLGFGDNCFEGQGIFMLADSAQQIVLPLSGEAEAEREAYLQQDGVQTVISGLREKVDISTTAVYCDLGDQAIFFFVSELEQPNLYLVGIVPYEVVASDLTDLFRTLVLVFALLLALLIIGTLRIGSADARARESDELRRAKQSVEEAYESKSRFLASMSHELRTPINTIMGMNEMILRESKEPDTRDKAMDVKSASQILLSLINDVLDFSKIESRMLTILPVEYRLSSLVRDLNLLSENRARSKSLDFKLDIQPDLPDVLLGDDIRIQQVLTNLLTNAVKYTQEGQVTLQIKGTRKDNDTILLHCAVMDTGIGLKPEDITKLMNVNPYTRVDEVRNRKVEGSGLGLPIITNLLKLMGSELKVESAYGQGSTFWFDLEQRIVEDEPIGDIHSRLESGAKEYEYRVSCYAPKAKVLVVDDNAMNRKIFGNLLKQTKIQVTAASSGAKCLKMVQQERFDLIFMDHLMPDMDGVETLRHLKEMNPERNLCHDTPVIALTANAFSGAQEKYMAVGFDAFLAKPIVTEKLEGLLMGMLPPELLEEPPEGGVQPEPAPCPGAEELPAIEGVNWEFALLHIRDSDLLLDTLKDFCRSLPGEREALEELAEDTGNEAGIAAYRTRVHAMKSTAAMVGILSVSELARLLEDAARSGETAKIRTLNPILLELLDKTKERLAPFMAESEPRVEADPSRLTPLLETLRVALESLDIAAADEMTRELSCSVWPGDIQTQLDQVSTLVATLDFDGAAAIVRRLLGTV